MTSNFCTMPFNSLEVSPDGTCKVCCKIQTDIKKSNTEYFNVLNDNINDIWHSVDLQLLRKKFLKNERPDECRLCWTEEESNVKSLRQQTATGVVDLENPKVTYLSLKLSNKCNLACRICSPHLSSLWQTQFKKLNLDLHPVEMFKTIDLEKFQGDRLLSLHGLSTNLTQLLIYGGEPLINDEVIAYLEYLADSSISKNIQLILNTNGTVYSEKIISIFKNFKFVDLFLSIDDIEKRFEYQRWPAKWEKIDANIQNYAKLSDNIKVEFYPSVSVLNILNIEEMLEKLSSYNVPITFNNIIHDPRLLSIRNLPKECKSIVIEKINSIDFSKFNFNKTYPDAKIALLSFLQLDNDEGLDLNRVDYLNKFNENMLMHDEARHTQLKDYIPELWNLLNGS
jgi:MoaA/NifB/PqqE/SkfB family radical SAM enzyme